jgi:FixJ family two-component response regulator
MRTIPLVCVVDDDRSVLRAVERLLRASAFAVATFASAEAYLQSEHRKTAGCLVLDVHLGGVSGLELQEQLAAAGTRTPIVFITAWDDATARERAHRAGAAGYLQKPFDDVALLGAVSRALAAA